MFVHVHHAVKHNAVKSAAILSNYVDIVMKAAAVFDKLQRDGLDELWVVFGQANIRRWKPIHTLVEQLGK